MNIPTGSWPTICLTRCPKSSVLHNTPLLNHSLLHHQGTRQTWVDHGLLSRPPQFLPFVCVQKNAQKQKSSEKQEGLGWFIAWMTSGGHEGDVGGGAQLLKQHTRLSVWVLYHSFGLQTLAWSKLLVFIGKKPAFTCSKYILTPPP